MNSNQTHQDTADMPQEGDHVMLIGLDQTAGYIVEIADPPYLVRVESGGETYWASPNHLERIK
jgi:hypothetical protein